MTIVNDNLIDWESCSDGAWLRILPSSQALTGAEIGFLSGAWGKLAKQFAQENRLSAASFASMADNHIAVLAWEGPKLSGCSHDKIHGLCRALHSQGGPDLLNQPPIFLADPFVAYKPAAFRHAFQAGEIDEQRLVWMTLAETLGDWRKADRLPVCSVPWLSSVVERLRQ